MTPHRRRTAAIVSRLLAWYASNARDLPWRRTTDPYGVLVSEIMLQQTQAAAVVPYWTRWMRALPTLAALAKAKPERLHKLWEGLGYYARVRNLQRAAQQILEKHHGEFPRGFEEVIELPGVGRYTAGAICSIAFDQPTPILDGNVMRVLTRLFAIGGDPRAPRTNGLLWNLAQLLVTQASTKASLPSACSHLNQALMELGALLCRPRNPECERCPVSKWCQALSEGRVDQLPQLRRRPKTTGRRFVAFVAQRGDRFLVRQRPAGVVNAHFWEFPNVELADDRAPDEALARETLGFPLSSLQPRCTIRHSITRYRLTIEVFRGVLDQQVPGRGRWVDRATLNRLPIASAHRKILRHLD